MYSNERNKNSAAISSAIYRNAATELPNLMDTIISHAHLETWQSLEYNCDISKAKGQYSQCLFIE